MRSCTALLLVVALVACDSSSSDPTGPGTSSPTSSPTTTTTIDNDTCERVAQDTTSYLERLIDTLDETRLRVLIDVEDWPPPLQDLQREGRDLDLRVAALRCDPAAIQEYAFTLADMTPRGPLAAELLELLLSPATTTGAGTDP